MRHQRAIGDAFSHVASVVEAICEWTVRLGLLIAVVEIVYILISVFNKQIFTVKPDDMAHALQLADSSSTGLLVSSLAASIVLVLRKRENAQEIQSLLCIAGLIIWFGLPALVGYVGHDLPVQQRTNPAVMRAMAGFVIAGKAMLATLVWPLCTWLWRSFTNLPNKRKAEAYAKSSGLKREGPKGGKTSRPNVLSPCWHLPYCRDYLLSVCPAYKARRRCWKFGRGCFCDPSMVENLITGTQGAKPGEMEYMRREIDARTGVSNLRGPEGRPPCRKCFIYIEHEKLKFDAIHFLAYPIAAGIVFFGYAAILQPVWAWLQDNLLALWQHVSFVPASVKADALNDVFGNTVITYMFAGLVGFVILLGTVRLMELWCLEWKL
jgi:hypothetical protein